MPLPDIVPSPSQRQYLALIDQGFKTRAMLSYRLDVRAQAVSKMVRRLLDAGLVKIAGEHLPHPRDRADVLVTTEKWRAVRSLTNETESAT